MVDKNRVIGSAKKAKGEIKRAIGKVTGDAKLEAEGTADKAEGTVQNAIGGLKDALKGK
ncbi:MAG: CsbD family protein [Thiobacillus sp.]|uniref:CsbD family protein n=1 Tax=Thiobacillus sp. TaxID=924 RepID=UPI002894E3E6|nr:CsbD family protein [Thiobacillus sp.]MDT3707368.1 CsbD family protein [Thiobacillus sp.]